MPFVTRINVFKTFCREGYGFGDNIFLFDTFTTAKRIVTEKMLEQNFEEKKFSADTEEKEEASKTPSPSATEWVQQIPELIDIRGLGNWARVCKHPKIDPKGASARLVLQNWVKKNRPNWKPVPDA